MENVPPFVSYIFLAIVATTLSFLIYAINQASTGRKNYTPTVVVTFLSIWLFITALATFQGFFANLEAWPPRFFLPILVAIVVIVGLLFFRKVRAFYLKMPIATLTYIHIIRVPVEIVLWWLAAEGLVATKMTFEGSNFDILTGVTAPFAAVFLVGMRSPSKFAAIAWNLAGLFLLGNIVSMAIRATPYFYDPLVFDNPNVAVFSFPFIWLPTFVVPAVLFAHLVSIYKLIQKDPE